MRPAEAGWATAETISGGGESASSPSVAIDAGGNAIAVWTRFLIGESVVRTAHRPFGGGWTTPRDLTADDEYASHASVAVDAAGTALVVWALGLIDRTARATARSPGGDCSTTRDLSAAGVRTLFPTVAVNAAGDAVATWTRYEGANEIVQAATRRAGGNWTTAQDLSSSVQDASSAGVAVDGAGNAVAACAQRRATPPYRRPVSTRWGRPCVRCTS